MTREDARKIVENFEVVKHFANGGRIIFEYKNIHGEVKSVNYPEQMLLNTVNRYKIAPEKLICPMCGQEVREE